MEFIARFLNKPYFIRFTQFIQNLYTLTIVYINYIKYYLKSYILYKLDSGYLIDLKDKYQISFYNGPNKYVIRFPKTRGPRPYSKVVTIINNKEIDVTTNIIMYSGPSHNFYGMKVTPNFLGYENLIFYSRDGNKRAINKDESI